MAFDGITIAGIAKELNQHLTGGRIYKIAQPESDELLLTINPISAVIICRRLAAAHIFNR